MSIWCHIDEIGKLFKSFFNTSVIFDDFDAKFGLFHPMEPHVNIENPRNIF